MFEWVNLIGACCGVTLAGEDVVEHCDNLRGDADLAINPAGPYRQRLAMSLRYEIDHTIPGVVIASDDEVLAAEIELLGLNETKLCENRYFAWKGFKDGLRKADLRKGRAEQYLRGSVRWREVEGEAAPFAPVVEWFARMKLQRYGG